LEKIGNEAIVKSLKGRQRSPPSQEAEIVFVVKQTLSVGRGFKDMHLFVLLDTFGKRKKILACGSERQRLYSMCPKQP